MARVDTLAGPSPPGPTTAGLSVAGLTAAGLTAAGLTTAQVARRRQAGQANVTTRRTSRGAWAIVRANVLTRFNAIIGVLLAVVLVFGQPQDGLFGLVILVNSAVGIVQELRAKRTLDALALLEQAPVRVRRDGAEVSVPPEDVVQGDLVLLSAGAKVPVDGTAVVVDGLEVDESLLTGEADPVAKRPGDGLLSGSFVVAGSGKLTATAVGDAAYANRLVGQISRFDLAHSTLMAGINRILRVVTWVIVPVGILLVVSQLRSAQSLPQAMVGSVAGLVPMIPEGLVLMTSVAFAVGVVRLGRHRCLVQELPAVEVLARVDVLCLDKTGTLTEPGMSLAEISPVPSMADAEVRGALGALARVEPHPNPTMQAIAEAVPAPGWQVAASVPFSSARKYSAATLDGHGTWVLGAPDVILAADDPVRAQAESTAATGLRVLALGRLADRPVVAGQPLGAVRAAALVMLRQRLRHDAAATLGYLDREGITVKVFSGDNAASVGAVAASLGLPGAAHPVDARHLGDDPRTLTEQLAAHSVFGRVTPQQKRAFVAALQAAGHTVAMTGDGVNDALALKDADLGVAMGSGSPASRGVAKVVLLDDSFAALPRVLAEGRRVLGNIERVASLFLVKTTYALVIAVLVGVAHLPFPFLPRHITLVGSLTIGIPGFFLALAPNTERAVPGFVRRVLRSAAPAGLVCGLAAFAAYGLARWDTASDQATDRGTATLALFLAAAWALALVARPYTWWRAALVAVMVAGFGLVAAVPLTAGLFALTFTDLRSGVIAVAVAAPAAAAMSLLYHLRGRARHDPG
ncbi:MAG TPA: HAD-IC family P-type ATPase [Micromonosporaceae bacterium]|nr:HAD-IC family P-type ATPase [Micromonosporaceae bacterium]